MGLNGCPGSLLSHAPCVHCRSRAAAQIEAQEMTAPEDFIVYLKKFKEAFTNA